MNAKSAKGNTMTENLPLQKGSFFYLFVALIVLLLLYPFFEGQAYGRPIMALLISVILLSAIYAVSDSLRDIIIAVLLGIPFMLFNWLAQLEIIQESIWLSGITYAIPFYLFTTFHILYVIAKSKKVTANILYGAVCVYLLFGLVWASIYFMVEQISPGSFQFAEFADINGKAGWGDFMYYSYVTLTNLGYGDITPVTARAKSFVILEAIIGVLYIAVMISRIVGLYITHRQKEFVE